LDTDISFNKDFANAQFIGSNFTIGSGPLFLTILGYFVFLALRACILKSGQGESKAWKWLYEKMKHHRVSTTALRFILEANVEILSWSLISTVYVYHQHNLGEKKQDRWTFFFGWLMLLALLAAPIYTVYLALRFAHQRRIRATLTTDEQKEEYSRQAERIIELFEDLRINLWSLLFYPIFIVRRMVLVFSLILLQHWGLTQIAINVIASLLLLLYGFTVKPF
jgi:hypothetical protein